MTPELATFGATRAAKPCFATVMVPALVTVALGLGEGMLKFIRPAMKSAFLMSAGVATIVLTSTWAPSVKTMPLWLTSTIRPLASIWPAMTEGSPPVTRLSVTEVAEGCRKTVVSPGAMLKLCQLMTAEPDDWLIWVRFAFCVIVAVPATTEPPAGLAAAGTAVAIAVPVHIAARRTRPRAVEVRWRRATARSALAFDGRHRMRAGVSRSVRFLLYMSVPAYQ